jgi:hypothetical protein
MWTKSVKLGDPAPRTARNHSHWQLGLHFICGLSLRCLTREDLNIIAMFVGNDNEGAYDHRRMSNLSGAQVIKNDGNKEQCAVRST